MPSEPANEWDPIAIDADKSLYPNWVSQVITFNALPQGRAWKYNKIWTAAALACMPIAPSHRYLKASALQQQDSAIAETVDRKRFIDLVLLGAGTPVFGPVTPANKLWYDPKVPTPPFDRKRAAAR